MARLFLAPFLLLGIGWGAAALWIDGPASRPLAGALAPGLALPGAWALAPVRPTPHAGLAIPLGVGLVAARGLRIEPRNDRDWLPDVARTAHADFDGSRVTIHNVRNFAYRSETDYDERWETRTVDLDHLTGANLFISFWGPTLIAHTIATFEF